MDASLRSLHERALLVLIASAPLLVIAGSAAAIFGGPLYLRIGALTVGAGLTVVVLSAVLSYPLDTLRTLEKRAAGGPEYDLLRHWGRLKTSAILLNLLTLIGVVTLVGALLTRLGVLESLADASATLRVSLLLTVVLTLNLTNTHYLSLRTPLERSRNARVVAFLGIGLALSLAATIVTMLLFYGRYDVPRLVVSDAPVLLLGSATAAALTLFGSRSFPTLYILFVEEQKFYTGPTYFARAKSLLVPALLASSLLLLIVLALLLLGTGRSGLTDPFVLIVIGFVSVAMAVAFLVSRRFARTEDQVELFREQRTAEQRRGRLVLGLSTGIALAFGIPGVLRLLDFRVPLPPYVSGADLVALSLLAFSGIYGFYHGRRLRQLRQLEARFPDFLRDLAASHRGGLTLPASVSLAARGDYGELTGEVRKMADQLSFGVSFSDVLLRFSRRVPTPLILRATTLINEAGRTGGRTSDVLLAAARDAREMKILESERRSTVGLYTVIIYLTFFVFLGVAAVLYATFIPEILRSTKAAAFSGGTGLGGIGSDVPTLAEYRTFYYLAGLVQAVGDGLLAGLMGTGRAVSGLRHCFLMVLATFVTFLALAG